MCSMEHIGTDDLKFVATNSKECKFEPLTQSKDWRASYWRVFILRHGIVREGGLLLSPAIITLQSQLPALFKDGIPCSNAG